MPRFCTVLFGHLDDQLRDDLELSNDSIEEAMCRCEIEYGPPIEYGPGGPYSIEFYPWNMDPPYGKWTPPPSIPTLILLHITLILLHIMYIAFPNLKHCKNKCLPIKKKNGPIQKHIRSLAPPPLSFQYCYSGIWRVS